MEFVLRIIFLIAGLVWISFTNNENLKYVLIGLVFSIIIEIVRKIIVFIKECGANFRSIILSITLYRKRKIRLSCSYLYKIKYEDKYLLVKNSHRESYQPVGGVYKRTEESTNFLNSISFNEDEKLTNGKSCNNDLRIHIKGKYLKKFLNWYNKNTDREISHTREFVEELISPGILTFENFPYPDYAFKRRIPTPLKWSKHFQCHELLIYDILELKTNPLQEEEFKKLYENGETDYIKWADAATIRGKGYNEGNRNSKFEIGDHTLLLIDLEYSKKYML